ncbi:MAG: glutamate 5-kinase [Clostridiales Family XIII bacterium]|jgi:glutamate 5-kinase|nr:glutamate 5-kinase [Clostridiales Family XIII bacterium]
MTKAAEYLKKSRKIVLKVGSNVLATEEGTLDRGQAAAVARQTLGLIGQGKQVLLVSSGAGVSGAGAIGAQRRRGDVNYQQALCAVGQVELMMEYKKHFEAGGRTVGQILLTAEDFENRVSAMNIRNTFFTLLDEGVVPIINENDSVSYAEILDQVSDNDSLAARTANLWNADLLILMTDVDGVYDASPKEREDARLIEEVADAGALLDGIEIGAKSSWGTGGMESKIRAAAAVGKYGIPLLLVNGRRADVLADVEAGGRCTIFVP